MSILDKSQASKICFGMVTKWSHDYQATFKVDGVLQVICYHQKTPITSFLSHVCGQEFQN